MRYPSFMILTCLLFFNLLCAQDNIISQGKWDTIVDFTNAKVTLAYINDLHRTSKPKVGEGIYFTDTLETRLANSSIKSPISYDSLNVLMAPYFEKTFKNLSAKIEEAKNNSKVLDSLYNTIEEALKGVRKEDIFNSNAIKEVKKEVLKYLEVRQKDPPAFTESLISVQDDPKEHSSFFIMKNVTIGILILLLLLTIFSHFKALKKIDNLKKELESEKLNNQKISPKVNDNRDHIIKTLRNDKQKITEELSSLQNELELLKSKFNSKLEVLPSSPIKNISTVGPVLIPEIFYGGKPSVDRSFIDVSDKIKEQETIFKFKYDSNDRLKATFEFVMASEFMVRQVTNAPDDFLYRVCNNINSNQDFRRVIITERKGIAHLRDGVWVVDENEKALIKFQ